MVILWSSLRQYFRTNLCDDLADIFARVFAKGAVDGPADCERTRAQIAYEGSKKGAPVQSPFTVSGQPTSSYR